MSDMHPVADTMLTRFKKRWGAVLFASLFAAVGAGMLIFSVLPSMYESVQMKTWHSVPAYLSSAGIKVSRGDDSDTYKAVATYRYDYQGQSYTNDRVSLSDTSDNIGSFQQDLGRRLKRAKSQGEPISVWVNPSAPSQSIIHRELRWEMVLFQCVFVFGFGGVGFGIIGWALFKPLSALHGGALDTKRVDGKPWLLVREWCSDTVYSDAKTSFLGMGIFALSWNVLCFPVAIFMIPEMISGKPEAFIVLLFPLVGIGLFAVAVTGFLRWRRFGKTPLKMDPYPGSIGGHVGGTMEVPIPFDPHLVFHVTLSCLYSRITGTGKNRRRSESVVSQQQGFAYTKSYNGGTKLEILFAVEDGLPESESQENTAYHLWRLNVQSKLPGADLDRNYEIPVFPTKQRSRYLSKLCTQHPGAEDHHLSALEQLVNIKQIAGGVELYYPAFHQPLSKISGIIIGLVFLGIGLAVRQSGAPIIFPIVFGGIGGLVALTCFLSLIKALYVRVDANGLFVQKTLLGLPYKRITLARDAITMLKPKLTSTSTTGSKQTEHYKLQALAANGDKIEVARNLKSREAANLLCESIGGLTGLATAR